jgi:hypothetical protein
MLGNSKLFYDLKEKNIMNADEQLLLFKIVNEYKNSKNLNKLYEILTKTKRKSITEIGVEAQPLTYRVGEGNTYLDLAMGSIKQRGNTESGIELDLNKEEQDFVFCEAKWKSDLSSGVSKCSIRNQLQRVIENALVFAGKEFRGKIFVTLITPEFYKKHYELGLNTRFYSCKYAEYKSNIKGSFLRELNLIEDFIPLKNIQNKDIIKENLNKLFLNWVTFEELMENSSPQLRIIYDEINKKNK